MTTNIIERTSVRRAIERFSDNPSAFLALNAGNRYFASPRLSGVIAYRQVGRYFVQFGGPFADPEHYDALLRSFLDFARERHCETVAVQLQRVDAPVYAEHGFTVNQIGASYAVDLAEFTMCGTRFMRLRNKIARAYHSGLRVTEARLEEWVEAVAEVDRSWLASKGEHVKPLEFLVGEHGGPAQEDRRLFLGLCDDKLVGYISYSPVYGKRPGWLHDLSRRLPGDPPGVMEAINSVAIEKFRSESVAWLHFGFTPFTNLRTEFEVTGCSKAFNWFMHWLGTNGDMVYPAASQLAYKSKWGPQEIIPEYVAFERRARISGFIQVFKAANAI